PWGHGFSLGVCVLRPRSRGEITLRSPDPRVPPAIQPRYLDDPADLELLLGALRLARRVLAGSPLDPYRGRERMPGQAVQSDAALTRYIRASLQTLYHPAGTCKMGHD